MTNDRRRRRAARRGRPAAARRRQPRGRVRQRRPRCGDRAAASSSRTRPDVLTRATAELTIALHASTCFAASPRATGSSGTARPGSGRRRSCSARGLAGRTLGIVGLGRIGSEVAPARRGLRHAGRLHEPQRRAVDAPYERLELDELLATRRRRQPALSADRRDAPPDRRRARSTTMRPERRARQHDARPRRRRGRARRRAARGSRSPAPRSTSTSASRRCIPACSSSRTSSSLRISAARPTETREAMGMLCVEALRAVLLEGRCPENALNPEALRGDGHESRARCLRCGRVRGARSAADAVIAEPAAAAHLRVRRADGLPGRPGARRAAAVDAGGAGGRARCVTSTGSRSSPAARAPGSRAAPSRTRTAIVISLARMNRILEIDLESGRVTVEPGVTNLAVTQAVAPHGFYYAPDPSSQQVCTIGGNVAENSGGAHCLKHGFTVNHVTGLEVVLPDGEVVDLGGQGARRARSRPDGRRSSARRGRSGSRRGSRCASCAGPRPFARCSPASTRRAQAGAAVSDVIAGGILAGAMEIMDRLTLEAAEAAVHPGYPDVGSVLIVELDGNAVAGRGRPGARRGDLPRLRRDRDPDRRATTPSGRSSGRAARRRSRRWAGSATTTTSRTGSFRARGCPEVLDRIGELEREYGLRVGNVFHAGDGNLHPLVLYDRRNAGRARAGEGARRGDPRDLHRRRRLAHRRARDRHGQGVPDAAHVLGGRPRGDAAAAPRLRPGRPLQPGQDLPDAAALRRGARARTAPIRWSWPALPSVSESVDRLVGEAASALGEASRGGTARLDRARGRRRRPLDTPRSTACSSTRRAT